MMKRVKRTYAELFLSKLAELSDKGEKLVSNKSLKDALGWDDDRYSRVKEELKSQEQIIVGRGFGGSVGMAVVPGSRALKVFISYSHQDEALKVELLKHLEPLRKLKMIDTWHDRKIKAGEDWGRSISTNLEGADLILLIVSIDFVNSNYCYEIELEKALERHAAGKAVLIPIIARSCLWKTAPFASIQAVPKDGRPIALWQNQDEALTSVAESIRDAATGMLTNQ